ncbi:nucleotide exchange factor GrpE [Thermocoleostomius sinensis]|uniref:Helix-turn-helix domain-containing protein n=1 Tax=Thermocoleostomius sinensis A174 TaxID=2016057 RepID=A0A9E8ZHA6_9CYAN|nr:helix-turn-helix domain-containing protein [Thermocoleostomius sinensis]WAL61752.1 helix-turn-helix domain-containing protein [Thermocoleostomius sinensis A174]
MPSSSYTLQLRSLMQQVGLSSFKQLGRVAQVSDWQIEQLRRGKADQMRMGVLVRLSQALQIPLDTFLEKFSEGSISVTPTANLCPSVPDVLETDLNHLRQECQRLQMQLAQQRDLLYQEFQHTSLQILESWLLQFPTAAYAAQQNPQAPAVRLLPLMRPIEQLLKAWGIEPIAAVGAELAFDPQHHQLMDGTAQPGDPVRVRYVGYRQGSKLLYRAKVSPVTGLRTTQSE